MLIVTSVPNVVVATWPAEVVAYTITMCGTVALRIRSDYGDPARARLRSAERLRPMLRLDDHYVWDSWIADDGDLYHLFFLQAPRSLGQSRASGTSTPTVGHATSPDLVDWDYLGDCFGPAESGWDDLAIWTGSVVRDGDQWRMFYTAVNYEGHGVYDQRVGSAISDDLHHWTRVGDQPAAHPDPRWYKTLALVPPAGAALRPTGRAERDLAGPAGLPRPRRRTAGTCWSPPARRSPAATTTG